MNASIRNMMTLLMTILGLAVTACGMDQYDPASKDSASSVDTSSQPLYRSFMLYNTTYQSQSGQAVDYLVSTDKNETLSGYAPQGAFLNVLTASSPTRVKIYRCSVNVSGSPLLHYVSTDQYCEGGNNDGTLGYLEQNPVGAVVVPVHRCTGSPYNLPGATSGPYLSEYHNLITDNPNDCQTNSTTPTILGYTI